MSGKGGARELLTARAHAAGAMLALHLELTSRCPLRCSHCYNDRDVADLLTLDAIEGLLAEAAELGCLFVALTGGEIWLRRDLEDIIAAARRYDYLVRLQTSGWFVDERAAAFLADAAVSEVDMSLYSADPVVHDAVTLTPGSHARVVAAARALRSRGVYVVLKTVVTDVNADAYESVRTLAEDLDCKLTVSAIVSPSECGDPMVRARRLEPSLLRDFYGGFGWETISEPYRDGAKGSSCRAVGERSLEDPVCGVAQHSLFVASDGRIMPCVGLNIDLGNVLTDRLAPIWRDSPVLNRLRGLRWRDLSACSSCSLRAQCSPCVGEAFAERGVLPGASRQSCMHALVRRDLLRDRGLLPSGEMGVPPPLRESDDQSDEQPNRGYPGIPMSRSSSSRRGR